MEKYSLEEIKKMYNNLSDKENTTYTKNQKLIILRFLLKELQHITCYNSKGSNCFYSTLNELSYKRGMVEKQYICNYYDLYSYSCDAKEFKYNACPFYKLEDDVKKLIKSLEGNIKNNVK